MGRTPKPLRFLIHPDIADWEEWEALRKQGHTVHTEPRSSDPNLQENLDVHGWGSYDQIFGPNCWNMDKDHKPYLELAIKAGRKKRYPK